MKLYTIGFTKKSARRFFDELTGSGIKRLVDIRLYNTSQLAGYTKRADLAYFLDAICEAEYRHEPLLAPSADLFDAYKKRKGSWQAYERSFMALLAARQVERKLEPDLLRGPTVLLCTEPTADRCHRRLVAEYLRDAWGELEIVHL
jgi:uncharacterized protein (DUF488 family)